MRGKRGTGMIYLAGSSALTGQTSYSVQRSIKEAHMRDVFLHTLKHENVTRAKLAKKLKLSGPAVSAIVDREISAGYILEKQPMVSNAIGRPPILIEINGAFAVLPVVMLKRHGLACTVYDFALREKYSFFSPYSREFISGIDYGESAEGLKPISDEIFAGEISRLLRTGLNSGDMDKAAAVVFSFPGNIDTVEETLDSVPMRIRFNVSALSEVKHNCGEKPLLFGNDAMFSAYGEYALNPAHYENMIYIDVGAGIGAGVVKSGDLLVDSHSFSFEIGHTTIDYNGPKCQCGNRGCLERYVNLNALVAEARNRTESGEKSLISDTDINIGTVAEAYDAGDTLVGEIMEKAAAKLVYGINNMVTLLSLRQVVIGGGIEKFGGKFLDLVNKKVGKLGNRRFMNRVTVSYAQFGPKCESYGAASYFLEKYFI
ncbi:MAG: ROK family transcriptional regulator [Eubacteriales bacterium]